MTNDKKLVEEIISEWYNEGNRKDMADLARIAIYKAREDERKQILASHSSLMDNLANSVKQYALKEFIEKVENISDEQVIPDPDCQIKLLIISDEDWQKLKKEALK